MNKPISAKNQPNVLMVDDTPANLELLSVMLKGRGYKVRAAVSGKLALQAARNDPPDLILLDISMPEMDGYEVCAQLKSEERLKDIPIIFLSALTETMDKVKAFGAGGVDYISKPFQFEEVEARVEAHLELRRQKFLLQENYSRLRGLEQKRDDLVNMIIHDLRTPLTIIAGYNELITEDKKNTLSAESAGYISENVKAVQQMMQIVSDVLDTSKMEEGQMTLQLADCDLGALLAEGAAGMASLLKGRKIRFTPPANPVFVRADRELVFRVVQNLLGNALKYTPDDSGLIELKLQPEGGRVRVEVSDNGPGIAPEHRQRVFEKFGQVGIRADHKRYSTGLGLTFCKLAVEAHGGSIGVDGEAGKGSSFWFELPVNGQG
ncbi:MAG: hypothetical protein A2X31_04400 [Elusimicrobia bacterium GWB2_63_22]|nr:MAG: hypothetical protein A2X31_04400 [Elusimicrobia bacterium GWB2_63_22]